MPMARQPPCVLTAAWLCWNGTRLGTVEIAASERVMVDQLLDELSEKPGWLRSEKTRSRWTSGRSPSMADVCAATVPAPDSSEIDANYSGPTALDVGQLMAARAPAAGRLILWHGEPGTGKTHALRALSRAWSGWCSTTSSPTRKPSSDRARPTCSTS